MKIELGDRVRVKKGNNFSRNGLPDNSEGVILAISSTCFKVKFDNERGVSRNRVSWWVYKEEEFTIINSKSKEKVIFT